MYDFIKSNKGFYLNLVLYSFIKLVFLFSFLLSYALLAITFWDKGCDDFPKIIPSMFIVNTIMFGLRILTHVGFVIAFHITLSQKSFIKSIIAATTNILVDVIWCHYDLFINGVILVISTIEYHKHCDENIGLLWVLLSLAVSTFILWILKIENCYIFWRLTSITSLR